MSANIEQLWSLFLVEAKIFEEKNEVYFSPTEDGKYQITSTVNNVIRIERLSKPGSFETMGFIKFNTCLERIERLKPIIKKGTIYEHVAEEVTLVNLLPILDWSDDGSRIIVSDIYYSIDSKPSIGEANNDNLLEKRLQYTTIRNGQNKFRLNLQNIYNQQCVISNCRVIEVLHACHINPHSITGNNLSTNGLLLRADLHDLFDSNLIAIHPETLKVSVAPQLKNTLYWDFNGVSLLNRSDGKKPDVEALTARWEKYHS